MNVKKVSSFLLALVISAALVPASGFAASTGTGKALQLVTDKAAANIAGGQASSVYFGTYKQTDDGQGGYSTDPIKWRVLNNADGKLFLLSDQNLDSVPYHEDYENITWERSTIRSWLNGYAASAHDGSSGTDYSASPAASFIGTAFSAGEQTAIPSVTVVNEDNPTYGTEGGNDTTDKVFLLSISEAENTAYGFTNNKSSIAMNTAYAVNRGVINTKGAGHWWMRSPGHSAPYAAHVDYYGNVTDDAEFIFSDIAVRPAFNIDLNSVLFTSAAEGGKSSGKLGAGALAQIDEYIGSDWKLTLLDSTRSGFAASFDSRNGDVWTIKYSGAVAGTDEYISALIVNSSGKVTYYGRLAEAQSGDDQTVTVNVSGKLGDSDKLYIFNEQYNGDKKTDYASSLKEVAAPLEYSVTVTPGANMTKTAASGAASQTVTIGSSITGVVYTANEGYYFPTDYTEEIEENVNGISVTRDSYTQITISGKPAANADITLPAATAKTDPDYTLPSGLTADYGKTLADVVLSGGWAWNDALSTSVGSVGDNSFAATFTPDNTAIYNTVVKNLTITVNKIAVPAAQITETKKAAALEDLVEDDGGVALVAAPAELPEGCTKVQYRVNGGSWSDSIPTVTKGGTYTVDVLYVGDANHSDITGDPIVVKVADAEYSFKTGTTLAWTEGADEPLVFTIVQSNGTVDKSFSHFTGVDIDGTALVNGTDYTAVAGSTVVTINPSALQSLSAGPHTVTVSFGSTSVSSTLTISAASIPATGDSSRMMLWASLAAASVCCIAAVFVYGRKNQKNNAAFHSDTTE